MTTLTNRRRIANVLTGWDQQSHPIYQEMRFAGYLEALLQSEGYLDHGDLPYKTTTYKRLIFPGTYEVRESYPVLMYRLATEYLMATSDTSK